MAPKIIDDINANREVLGKLSSYYKQWLSGTPVSDPKASQMMAELMSFAATQPALHAFRSTNAMEAFEKIIGGLAKDPDSTIATIQGMLKLPETFTNMPQRTPQHAAPTGQLEEGTTRTNKRTGEVQTWAKDKTGKLGWQTTTPPRQ
jgi:hypothetical protein